MPRTLEEINKDLEDAIKNNDLNKIVALDNELQQLDDLLDEPVKNKLLADQQNEQTLDDMPEETITLYEYETNDVFGNLKSVFQLNNGTNLIALRLVKTGKVSIVSQPQETREISTDTGDEQTSTSFENMRSFFVNDPNNVFFGQFKSSYRIFMTKPLDPLTINDETEPQEVFLATPVVSLANIQGKTTWELTPFKRRNTQQKSVIHYINYSLDNVSAVNRITINPLTSFAPEIIYGKTTNNVNVNMLQKETDDVIYIPFPMICIGKIVNKAVYYSPWRDLTKTLPLHIMWKTKSLTGMNLLELLTGQTDVSKVEQWQKELHNVLVAMLKNTAMANLGYSGYDKDSSTGRILKEQYIGGIDLGGLDPQNPDKLAFNDQILNNWKRLNKQYLQSETYKRFKALVNHMSETIASSLAVSGGDNENIEFVSPFQLRLIRQNFEKETDTGYWDKKADNTNKPETFQNLAKGSWLVDITSAFFEFDYSEKDGKMWIKKVLTSTINNISKKKFLVRENLVSYPLSEATLQEQEYPSLPVDNQLQSEALGSIYLIPVKRANLKNTWQLFTDATTTTTKVGGEITQDYTTRWLNESIGAGCSYQPTPISALVGCTPQAEATAINLAGGADYAKYKDSNGQYLKLQLYNDFILGKFDSTKIAPIFESGIPKMEITETSSTTGAQTYKVHSDQYLGVGMNDARYNFVVNRRQLKITMHFTNLVPVVEHNIVDDPIFEKETIAKIIDTINSGIPESLVLVPETNISDLDMLVIQTHSGLSKFDITINVDYVEQVPDPNDPDKFITTTKTRETKIANIRTSTEFDEFQTRNILLL